MALTVRWTPIALRDLESAFEFITAENPTAAKAVVSKILGGIEQLRTFPESGRDGRVRGSRELVISTTPYVIAYRIKESHLDILAILHSSRKWP